MNRFRIGRLTIFGSAVATIALYASMRTSSCGLSSSAYIVVRSCAVGVNAPSTCTALIWNAWPAVSAIFVSATWAP